ncbi:MAG: copper amine oxidase N-terminal domain-containing protein [Lachnospirales bacterium]
MLKTTILIILSLLMVIPVEASSSYQTPTNNSDSLKISEKGIDMYRNSTYVNGSVPLASGAMSDEINEIINDIYTENIINTLDNRTKNISVSYKTYKSGNYTSIIILYSANDFYSKTFVNTIVANTETEKIISLTDYLTSQNITIDYINTYVDEYINKNINDYNNNFTGVSLDNNFYINNNNLYVTFDGYELLNNKSYISIEIPVSKIKKYTLEPNSYYLGENFSIKMIPLRQVGEAFDYSIGWDSKNKNVTVKNKDISATLVVGQNEYSLNNNNLQLEEKPAVKNDITYVPITFFSDVLGLYYSSNSNGSIIFYQ